jgi:hypothetical protein
MKINSVKLTQKTALTTAVIWLVANVIVFLLPDMMPWTSSLSTPVNLERIGMDSSMSSFVIGLFGLVFISGIIAWFFAKIYNVLQNN